MSLLARTSIQLQHSPSWPDAALPDSANNAPELLLWTVIFAPDQISRQAVGCQAEGTKPVGNDVALLVRAPSTHLFGKVSFSSRPGYAMPPSERTSPWISVSQPLSRWIRSAP